MTKLHFLYLIIYILFSFKGLAQQLHLKMNGFNEVETAIIDSISYNKTFKDFKSLEHEVSLMQTKLSKTGYIEHDLNTLTKNNDSTYQANFSLNKKHKTIFIYYKDSEITYEDVDLISKNATKSYFSIPIHKIEDVLFALNNKITNNGFPFARLKLTNISKYDNNNLRGDLTLTTSKEKRTIDDIIIKGYKNFPKTYIKHYLKIKKNQTFDLNAIKQKTKKLNNLLFTKELKSPEVLFTKDSTTLYLYLEKTKSNNFDGFLGFGNNSQSKKIEFNGYLNLNLTNNLNLGETFSLKYKSEENDQNRFNIKVDLPYLFNSPLGTELQLDIFRRDSTFNTTSQSAKLYYQINSQSRLLAGINTLKSENLLANNTSSNLQDYDANFYTINYQLDIKQLQNLFFKQNFMFDLEFGFGNRDNNTSEKQTSLRLNTFKIFNFNKKNSFYVRLNGFNLNSTSYLDNELTRFGGINSIRGFEENSIYANLYGLVNTEYRYLLSPSTYIHSIIDTAYFENDIFNQKEKLYTFGLGFGVLTKAGILRLNYANGRIENNPFKFSDSKIHISLSTIF